VSTTKSVVWIEAGESSVVRRNGHIPVRRTRIHSKCCRSLFLRAGQERAGQITLVALYVGDLLIASADEMTLDAIKKALSLKFVMKDMGEAQKCLGLEIFRCRKNGVLSMSQSEYTKTVLARYNMDEIYGANTPKECGIDLHDVDVGNEHDGIDMLRYHYN
jgi:hypothetical protein